MFHIKGTSVDWGSQGMGQTRPRSMTIPRSTRAMAAKDVLLGLFSRIRCRNQPRAGWSPAVMGGQEPSVTDLGPISLHVAPASSSSWLVVLRAFYDASVSQTQAFWEQDTIG